MLTKGAIGNLINRYKAVLTKCNLINVFGSLAVASMLVTGSACPALAEDDGSPEFLQKMLDITMWAGKEGAPNKDGNFVINKEYRQLIFGGKYNAGIETTKLHLNTGGHVYGELNAGGLSVGKGNSANVGTTEIKITGGVLEPTGPDFHERPGEGFYTYIRGGGCADNIGGDGFGSVKVEQANIIIKNNPELRHVNIYGGGVNGGTDNNRTNNSSIHIIDTNIENGTVYAGGDNAFVGTSIITLDNVDPLAVLFAGGQGDDESSSKTIHVVINANNSTINDLYTGAEDTSRKHLPGEKIDTFDTTETVHINLNSSTIGTYSDQIFANGLGEDGKNTSIYLDSDTQKENAYKSGVTISGSGTEPSIYLKDKKFNYSYFEEAQSKLDEYNIIVNMKGTAIDNVPIVENGKRFSEGYHDNRDSTMTVKGTYSITGHAKDIERKIHPDDKNNLNGSSVINAGYASEELFKNSGKTALNITSGGLVAFGNLSEKTGGTVSKLVNLDDGTISAISGDFTLAEVSTNATTNNTNSKYINITNGNDSFTITKLTADADTLITIGDKDNAGKLYLGDESSLAGAGLFLDPAWKDDPTVDIIGNASHAILEGTNIDGKLTAGQNSLLVLGEDSAKWAEQAFNDSGLKWKDDVTAAVAIVQPQKMKNGLGSLRVDGSLTADSAEKFATADDATFADKSLLMVKPDAAVSGNTALTGTGAGTLTVDSGASLYISNAKANESYSIAKDFASSDVKGWNGKNLITNRLVKAELTEKDGEFIVTTSSNIMPDVIARNSLASLETDINSPNMGTRFLSRAVDPIYLENGKMTATINEVSRAAVTAGVQNTSLRLSDAASDTVLNHLSLSFFDSGNSIHQDGIDMWATPMYGNTYTHGMGVSGTSVRGNYGGIAFGADMQVGEIAGGKIRVGAALNGGGGKSEISGTATSTENSYNFGGVNLYAGWNLNSLNVIASLGYGIGSHDVKMNLPTSMQIGQAKADVDTGVFTADLRAEYQIKTSWLDILPHAGVRYTSLHTDRHDLKVSGSTLNSVKSDTQNIVQFPVGVTVTKNIDVAGWNVKPQADVSVIPAAGDRKALTKVSYSGIDAMDSVNTRIMDSTSFGGMVGLQASKGNLSVGLNYGVQASRHETDQKVNVGISWKF